MEEISKLQAPECRLDSRRSRASKTCGIVPCGVCAPSKHEALSQCCFIKTTLGHTVNVSCLLGMYIGMHGCAKHAKKSPTCL